MTCQPRQLTTSALYIKKKQPKCPDNFLIYCETPGSPHEICGPHMARGRQAGGPRSMATPNPKINNEGVTIIRGLEKAGGDSEVSIFVVIVDVICLMKILWSACCQDQGRPIPVLL